MLHHQHQLPLARINRRVADNPPAALTMALDPLTHCHPEHSEGSAAAPGSSKWRYFRVGHNPPEFLAPPPVRCHPEERSDEESAAAFRARVTLVDHTPGIRWDTNAQPNKIVIQTKRSEPKDPHLLFRRPSTKSGCPKLPDRHKCHKMSYLRNSIKFLC